MKEALKYQEIDLEIKKIETEIANNENRKKATEMQEALKNLQGKMVAIELSAKQIVDKIVIAEKCLKDAVSKLSEASKKAEKVSGEKIGEWLSASKALQMGISKLEKEIMTLSKQSEDSSRELESVLKNAKVAKGNLIVYRDNYDKFKSGFDSKLAELKKQLIAQESKVDKKLIAKYHAKQTGKNTMVIVPEKDGKCGGCRMELSTTAMKKLKENGFLECENCGRIIYLEK